MPPFEVDDRDLTGDFLLVIGEKGVESHNLRSELLSLGSFDNFSGGIEGFGTHFDRDLGMRDQIPIPVRVGWRAGVRGDHEQVVIDRDVHQRRRVALAGLGIDGRK